MRHYPVGTRQRLAIDLVLDSSARVCDLHMLGPQLAKQGAESAPGTPQEFGSYIAAEITRWKKVAQDAGITPE